MARGNTWAALEWRLAADLGPEHMLQSSLSSLWFEKPQVHSSWSTDAACLQHCSLKQLTPCVPQKGRKGCISLTLTALKPARTTHGNDQSYVGCCSSCEMLQTGPLGSRDFNKPMLLSHVGAAKYSTISLTYSLASLFSALL